MSAADRLHQIRERIARAASLAKRNPATVTLIAVSKTRSVGDIEALIAAGQRDFGESRVQETQDKWPEIKARYPDLRLHMIGRLQSNKAPEAAELFDSIHSVDRPGLIEALIRTQRTPDCFVQVNIGEEEQKGGIGIGDLTELLQRVRATPLPLAGLMAIPPLGSQPGPYFALLAKLARRHGVTGLSMGMSGDFEAAVMLGATHVRVGTALFDD